MIAIFLMTLCTIKPSLAASRPYGRLLLKPFPVVSYLGIGNVLAHWRESYKSKNSFAF